MNPKVTRSDPRYVQARRMKADGMSSRAIKQVLRIRWTTLTDWLSDATPARQNATPPAYAEGYRWFNTRWK